MKERTSLTFNVAEYEVPCYLLRFFLYQVDQIFFKEQKCLLQILTHSVTGRTQELLLKNICHIRPVANSISTTQFHLCNLANKGNSKDITFRAFTN